MAALDATLAEHIQNMYNRSIALNERVLDYANGNVGQAVKDLKAAKEQALTEVEKRESALLGMIQRNTSTPVPSLLFDFKARTFLVGHRRLERSIDPYELLSVNRSTPKWVWDSQKTLSEVGQDELAYEYDPMTGESLGHLNEPKSTNELLYCNMWNYNYNAVAFTGGADSFPGGKSGTHPVRVVPTSENSEHYVRQRNRPDNTGQPLSYYLHFKPQGCHAIQIRVNGYRGHVGATFNAASESVTWTAPDTTYAKIVPLPDGWYRCEVAGVAESNGSFVHVFLYDGDDQRAFVGDGVSGIDLYWGQLELRTTPTSPIWTDGTPTTRDADNIRIAADGWQNSRQCSLFVECSIKEGGDGSDNIATLGQGVGGERVVLSKRGQFYVTTLRYGNSFVGSNYTPSVSPAITSYAMSYREMGDAAVVVDRGAESRSLGAMSDKALEIRRLTLGTQHHLAAGVVNGHIRTARYYPFYMNQAELATL